MTPRPAPESVIDSPRNAAVRRTRALERDRFLRERSRIYLAWGLHLAREALEKRARLLRAFAGPRLQESGEGRAVLAGLRAAGVPVLRVTTRVLDSIIEGSGDQGILLEVARPEAGPARLLDKDATLVLAAHGVQDPGNLGSILRSAWAFEADGFVALPGCADPFGSRAVRAAMGAHFVLPIAPAATAAFLEAARTSGLDLIAADASSGEVPEAVDLTRPLILLLGGEGAGLPPDLLRAARRRLRIPIAEGVDSLNVHAAAAILLYEIGRQRRRRPSA